MNNKKKLIDLIQRDKKLSKKYHDMYFKYLDVSIDKIGHEILKVVKLIEDLGIIVTKIPREESYEGVRTFIPYYKFSISHREFFVRFLDMCESEDKNKIVILLRVKPEKPGENSLVFKYLYELTDPDSVIGDLLKVELITNFKYRGQRRTEIHQYSEDKVYELLYQVFR